MAESRKNQRARRRILSYRGSSQTDIQPGQNAPSGSTGTSGPAPTINLDAKGNPVPIAPGTALPPATSGAGRAPAATSLPAVGGPEPEPRPEPLTEAGLPPGFTPEMGRAMLAEAGSWMRGIGSQEPVQRTPGFFEERFKDKEAGKEIDAAVDGGLNWFAALFDTEDESDLHIGPANLSAVESTWDAFWTGFGIMTDTVAMGASGAMLAANPHYWENRDKQVPVYTTKNGKRVPVRDRQGNVMYTGEDGNLWNDAVNVSPGRALQALASPVQDMLGEAVVGEAQGVYSHDPNFDIGEREQRDSWFENTPQKIGSGLGDAVIGTALDPTIFLGKGAQLARLRFLARGIKGPEDVARVSAELENSKVAFDGIRDVVDDNGVRVTREIEDLSIDEVMGLNIPESAKLAHASIARVETEASVARRASIEAIEDADERAARLADHTPEYKKALDEEALYARLKQLDVRNRDAMTAALRNARNYEESSLILRHAAGDLNASRALDSISPMLYHHVLEGERKLVSMMVRSDPALMAKEAKKWEKRYEMVEKRLDELEQLRAEPAEIAKTRAVLDDISKNWEYAEQGVFAPIGAGPKPSPAEIDLLRRSIDQQLEGNLLFERSLREASGEPSQIFGAMGSKTKGFTAFAEGLREGSVAHSLGSTLDEIVARSRMGRAETTAAARSAPNLLSAVKHGWRQEFYGIDKTKPVAIVHGPQELAGELLTNLGRPARAVGAGARYLWAEKPSGMIQTSGIGAHESSREIRAVVRSVALYQGEARVGKNQFGNTLYRTKDGGVVGKDSRGRWVDFETNKSVKVKDEKNLTEYTVGGEARGLELIEQYQNAMLLGGREAQAAVKVVIDQLEEQFVRDIAAAHGIPLSGLKKAHYKQNRRLEKIEKDILKDHYWIEDGDTTRHYAPWLETHLQNSTFMKNWERIEDTARLLGRERNAKAAGAGLGDKAAYAATKGWGSTRDTVLAIDNAVQNVWRPLVLMRAGYTQRNVLEGMFRSSMYLFSPAPVWDAAKQIDLSLSATGLSRRQAQRVTDKAVEQAQAGMDLSKMPSGFRKWLPRQEQHVNANIEHTQRIVTENRVRLAEHSAAYRERRVTDLNTRYAHIMDSSAAARDEVDRIGQIAFPDANDQALLARAEAVLEMNTDRLTALSDEMHALSRMEGGRDMLTSAELRQMDTLDYLEYVDLPYYEVQKEVLSDVTSAALTWQKQTMAHKRVHGKTARHLTDTDTMETIMQGRALNDPFDPEDPYAAIALQNLSADHTMRQTAAMRLRAETDWLTLRETSYYVDVHPGTPEYWNGVATALNQVQNSSIGKVVIKGRAEGKADAEIIDDVVRFLYETDEGAVAGAAINRMQDAFFKGPRFVGAQKQADKAMRQRVKDTDPLYAEAEQAKVALKSAYGAALAARKQMPKPRFAGDTPDVPKRAWDVDKYGDFETVQVKRGEWEILDSDGNVVGTATNRKAARAATKQAQIDADDSTRAHWTRTQPVVAGGREFYTEADIDSYLAEMQAARNAAVDKYDAAFNAPLEVPGNEARFNVGSVTDPKNQAGIEDARLYAQEVLHRYDVMTAGNPDLQKYLFANPQLPIGGKHPPKAAEDIIKGFLDGQDNLQPVIGNIAGLVGYSVLTDDVQKVTQRIMKVLGTIPEDALVRAPFYGRVYKEEANRMYDIMVGQVGRENLTMAEVNAIRAAAHSRALKDTKDWLYTIDRRTTFGESMEKVVPFASAMQNGVTAVGRLVWHDPTIAAIMANLWAAPQQAGWERDGIVYVPSAIVPKAIREAAGIGDEVPIGKSSMNLMMNFDISPNPVIAMSMSEAMKGSWFGISPDQTHPMLSWMGPQGDAIWQAWKDFNFGEGYGASTAFASFDRFFPPAVRRGIETFLLGPGGAKAVGDMYQKVMMSEGLKYEMGERPDMPQHEEIMGRVESMTWARMFGNVLLPAAPRYERALDEPVPDDMVAKLEKAGLGQFATLGEAIRANDELWYTDQGRITALKARQRAGEMIPEEDLQPSVMPSEELFGEAVWRAYKFKARENTAGLPATQAAVKFAREQSDFIGRIAGTLDDEGMLDLIGMFSQNPDDLYDPDAQAWFMANDIPGASGETFGTVMDPLQAQRQITVQEGWKVFMRGKEALELDARQQGMMTDSGNFRAGAWEWKKRLIEFEKQVADDYPGWSQSKASVAARSDMTVSLIATAMQDEKFQKGFASDPVWRKGGYAEVYITERKRLTDGVAAVRADMRDNGVHYSTSSKAKPWNDMVAQLEQRWAYVQTNLRNVSPSWAAIQDRYIGDDDTPKELADFYADGEIETEEAS